MIQYLVLFGMIAVGCIISLIGCKIELYPLFIIGCFIMLLGLVLLIARFIEQDVIVEAYLHIEAWFNWLVAQ